MTSTTTTVRRYTPSRASSLCDVEATVVTTSHATEVFARCAPAPGGTDGGSFALQARSAYDGLLGLLEQLGAEMGHVLVEKAFFRDVAGDFADFEEVRGCAYRNGGVWGERLPATTYLGQPPCRPNQAVELQAYAVIPTSPQSVRVRALSPAREHLSVKLVQIGQARHLYLGNVSGQDRQGRPLESFRRQSDAMFDAAVGILGEHGVAFADVLRTWIYLDDIDRDYGELNASRNAFFRREKVRRLPASTGIGAKLHPPGTWCSLDVYALLTPEVAEAGVMRTPTLNEAPEYGSAFSRGMRMALAEQTYLFVSGTASVDECGATAHVGDVRGQIERMLLNVEELLRPHGATFADLVHAVTYLKSAGDFELYRRLCAERRLVDVPHTIVQADVCRPELLCEMEAVAIVPTRPAPAVS